MDAPLTSRKVRIAASLLITALLATALATTFIPPPTAAQSTVSVSIQNFAFSPSSIIVVIGVNTTVTWTNHDSVDHTVTADDGSFDSGDIAPGAAYTSTFTVAGTYTYHCSIHTYMKGTVVVENAGTTTTTTGVPEFPFQAVAVTAFATLVVASYLLSKRDPAPRGPAQ